MSIASRLISAGAALALTLGISASAQAADTVKNIVLVHGAFADGSGWKAVYDILKKDGYNVSVVQEPETSLADDITATKRVLEQQSGSTILVGHSYGGAIITGAGSAPNVVGLVYVAAFQPDKGESAYSLASGTPASSNGIRPTKDAYLFVDPAEFHADFAADLSDEQAEFLSHSQVPVAAAAFSAPLVEAPWQTKPSWAIVASEDKMINPELQRSMYKRAKSKVTEIKSSHAVYISHPQKVAKVIEEAAQNAAK